MMKKILLTALASFLGWSVSHASVTNIVATYSGGIYCYQPVLGVDGNGQSPFRMVGDGHPADTLGHKLCWND